MEQQPTTRPQIPQQPISTSLTSSPLPSPSHLRTIILTIILTLASVVVCYFAYQEFVLNKGIFQLPLTQIPSTPSPAVVSKGETVTQTPDADLANWKTYLNTVYSYQIQLPSEWKKLAGPPEDNQVLNLRKSDYEIGITTVQTQAATIQDYLKTADKTSQTAWEGQPGTTVLSTKLTKINDYAVVQREEQWLAAAFAKPVINTYFLHNKRIYSITLKYLGNDPKAEPMTALYNTILATFVFTNKPASSSNIQTYTSKALGVRFSYKKKYDDGEVISTKEVGNKIYVYPSVMAPEKGQYIEVFQKTPTDSLETAITKTILGTYNAADCPLKRSQKFPTGNSSVMPSTYQVVTMSLPSYPDDPTDVLKKCPSSYISYGGIAFFVMDTNHPSTFVFLSIGQYAITGDTETNMWPDTLEFLN